MTSCSADYGHEKTFDINSFSLSEEPLFLVILFSKFQKKEQGKTKLMMKESVCNQTYSLYGQYCIVFWVYNTLLG
jgi:hypothetical protein